MSITKPTLSLFPSPKQIKTLKTHKHFLKHQDFPQKKVLRKLDLETTDAGTTEEDIMEMMMRNSMRLSTMKKDL